MNIFCVHNTMGRVISCIFRSSLRPCTGNNRNSIETTGHKGQNMIPYTWGWSNKIVGWSPHFLTAPTGLEWSLLQSSVSQSSHVTRRCALLSSHVQRVYLTGFLDQNHRHFRKTAIHARIFYSMMLNLSLYLQVLLLPKSSSSGNFATSLKSLCDLYSFCHQDLTFVLLHTHPQWLAQLHWFVHTSLSALETAGLSGHGLAFKY